MHAIGVKGCRVKFSPGAGWNWHGWDGTIEVSPAGELAAVEGAALVVDQDIDALPSKIVGKSYTASGFDATPGTIAQVVITIDRSTLSKVATCDGAHLVVARTRGDFTIQCAPSYSGSSPPVPDPAVSKSGSWEVEDSNQKIVASA